MKQIHFLTEAELKQRLDRKTFESLFENSHPSEFVLKEFYDQVKTWAQELDAKYWIEFPDSLFETFASEKLVCRSISLLTDFRFSTPQVVPSTIFPAYVWKKCIHFPFASNEPSLSSKIATIEKKIELVSGKKINKKGNTSVFRLEFQILSQRTLDLKKILELPIPENFTERIIEEQGKFFLITPKLNGVQSLFAIHVLSNISEKIEFNFCKLKIDLSENQEMIPIWFSRSGAILSAIDFENSPLYTKNTDEDFSALEIAVPPWLSPSFLFLVLESSLLDVWENLNTFSSDTKIPNSFPRFEKNESWRNLTEHRFASRVSRHAGFLFHSLLQKEYKTAKNVLTSILENRRKKLEEFEIPDLLNRLKVIQDFSQTISFDETVSKDWESIQTEITNSILERWKKKKELEAKKIEEISSASTWKILIEIWKSSIGRKP
ncbi:hypothetical protein [Leptospira borgpetersenii]|uniref:Uncharacterized protein n=1 Tax=Leptospira borgpetersenii serovar Hardjo-bovis str. Sponselee TaxID=1303729 RepID=M6CG08_LEPBO|nr:hypothetical protein [Leptospira borgpetersenii]AMX58741.1 hypothetical protein LBK6_10465 [Leptospira borgpetersenii serovar Hardjo]AMX61995.1 hypothetical protein LBK9_10505 [Leptospira borgpetersenii serovar Hardjo]AMX65238.1 hypothetical protein LBK30_10525 [Leptospira borgpetersenii serovar Hardjo]AMX68448.1 hypothetical protein LBHA_10360 [Leptospira borgpetersenii serovar Hardjo]AMX70800.1 hypothetical protein LBHB_05675 [Leptospira borgpetersenii serovar Hardjo]